MNMSPGLAPSDPATVRPPAVFEPTAAPVEAPLTYLVDTGERPATYMPPTEGGEIRRTGSYAPRQVAIRDGRPLAPYLSLDREGFVLVRQATRVSDFFDEDKVRAAYYPEIKKLVRDATGGAEVLIFDHTVRVEGGPDRDENGLRAPVHMVHNDYTAKSGPQRVRDLLGPELAAQRLKRRVQEINVWRPIAGPVLQAPLALADASSVAPEDLVRLDLVYPDRVGEIYNATFSPDHRWFYFPEMTTDEAVVIKGYDSLDDGRARFTLHTAFDDPNSPADAPPRQSIEVRALVFHDR